LRTDQTVMIASCQQSADQAALGVCRLCYDLKRMALLRVAEQPGDEEEVASSRLDDGCAREHRVADGIADGADP
jgi:hypothetical protein